MADRKDYVFGEMKPLLLKSQEVYYKLDYGLQQFSY